MAILYALEPADTRDGLNHCSWCRPPTSNPIAYRAIGTGHAYCASCAEVECPGATYITQEDFAAVVAQRTRPRGLPGRPPKALLGVFAKEYVAFHAEWVDGDNWGAPTVDEAIQWLRMRDINLSRTTFLRYCDQAKLPRPAQFSA